MGLQAGFKLGTLFLLEFERWRFRRLGHHTVIETLYKKVLLLFFRYFLFDQKNQEKWNVTPLIFEGEGRYSLQLSYEHSLMCYEDLLILPSKYHTEGSKVYKLCLKVILFF